MLVSKCLKIRCGVVKADIRITFIMLKRFKCIAVDLCRRPICCRLVCVAGQFVAGQLIKTNCRRLICSRLIDGISLKILRLVLYLISFFREHFRIRRKFFMGYIFQDPGCYFSIMENDIFRSCPGRPELLGSQCH